MYWLKTLYEQRNGKLVWKYQQDTFQENINLIYDLWSGPLAEFLEYKYSGKYSDRKLSQKAEADVHQYSHMDKNFLFLQALRGLRGRGSWSLGPQGASKGS